MPLFVFQSEFYYLWFSVPKIVLNYTALHTFQLLLDFGPVNLCVCFVLLGVLFFKRSEFWACQEQITSY